MGKDLETFAAAATVIETRLYASGQDEAAGAWLDLMCQALALVESTRVCIT
jgi:hypothetical protein